MAAHHKIAWHRADGVLLADFIARAWESKRAPLMQPGQRTFLREMAQLHWRTKGRPALSARQIDTVRQIAWLLQIPAPELSLPGQRERPYPKRIAMDDAKALFSTDGIEFADD